MFARCYECARPCPIEYLCERLATHFTPTVETSVGILNIREAENFMRLLERIGENQIRSELRDTRTKVQRYGNTQGMPGNDYERPRYQSHGGPTNRSEKAHNNDNRGYFQNDRRTGNDVRPTWNQRFMCDDDTRNRGRRYNQQRGSEALQTRRTINEIQLAAQSKVTYWGSRPRDVNQGARRFEPNGCSRPNGKRRSDLSLVSKEEPDYIKKVVVTQTSNAIQSLTREFTDLLLNENEFYKGRDIVNEFCPQIIISIKGFRR